MRTLDEHKTNSANEQLDILVIDEPGHGGASHCYHVTSPDFGASILFQNGPILEVGVNGLTHEALLAIIIDRLRSFQAGPYACEANHNALDHAEHALFHLRQRTIARLARGVEGTHTV